LDNAQILPLSGQDEQALAKLLQREGLRLTPGEARRMLELLGRDPTRVEATIFDTMWSEHCSYKSSRWVLKAHLPVESPRVILGPGEDAGVVRLGVHQGVEYALVIAHESHNHPSQVVPTEGAATGIGGIVRDVACMGAEVIGVLDALRFGDPDGPRAAPVREIVRGVVDGIWQYGDALGVPNLGGDVFFSPRFDENCLVNVVSARGASPAPPRSSRPRADSAWTWISTGYRLRARISRPRCWPAPRRRSASRWWCRSASRSACWISTTRPTRSPRCTTARARRSSAACVPTSTTGS